jgi:hypothetical protein
MKKNQPQVLFLPRLGHQIEIIARTAGALTSQLLKNLLLSNFQDKPLQYICLVDPFVRWKNFLISEKLSSPPSARETLVPTQDHRLGVFSRPTWNNEIETLAETVPRMESGIVSKMGTPQRGRKMNMCHGNMQMPPKICLNHWKIM